MPGGWRQQLVGRDSHHGAHSGYRRLEQSGRVPPPEENGEDAKAFFNGLVVLLAVGPFVWWRWHSK